MTTTRYRRFLTDLGEPAILPDHLGVLLSRRLEFTAATGLDDNLVHVDPLVSFPLAVYPLPAGDKPSRWSGRLDFMWNPLAWLPAPIQRPMGFSEGNYPVTSGRVWASTLVMSFAASGLYSTEYGFVDVAATYNIDLADLHTLKRLAAWVAGASDQTFDRVQAVLSAQIMSQVKPLAISSLLPYLPAQQAVIADGLLRSLDACTDPESVLPMYLSVARELLGDAMLPGHPVVGVAGVTMLSDVLAGIHIEITPPPHHPSWVVDEQVSAEALDDFRGLLNQVVTG